MMGIGRQVHLQWLVLTVTLMFGSVPAQSTPYATIYEFCRPNAVQTVRVNTTSPPFIIQSTNFGTGDYPNGVNCSLDVVSFLQPVVLSYYFRQFDVEYQRICSFDSLTVDSVKYCGNWEVGRMIQSFLPASSVSTLRFTTDRSVTRPGFQIIVIPDAAVKNQRSTGNDTLSK